MAEKDKEPKILLTASAIHHTKKYGDFTIYVAQSTFSKREHVVLVKNEIANISNVICRVQSECLPGTVLDSASCECKEQLNLSLEMINQAGSGILILLRQEGRGHGLSHKIKALKNKNNGYDTFKAVEIMGDKPDIRSYKEAADILDMMNVHSIHLLTNNSQKTNELDSYGIIIESVSPLNIPPTEHTILHLTAKKERGHNICL